jgi:acyl-CoA reductase-like NAD-dependent aldehyde dehydrogenase
MNNTNYIVDLENIDLASNWEVVPQVLEVRACLEDKEAIQQQVNAIYEAAVTAAQKQQLYQQLADYLAQRAKELEKLGGQESLIYAREKNIVRQAIEQHQLLTEKTAVALTSIENDSQHSPTAVNEQANDHQPSAVVTPQSNTALNTPSEHTNKNGATLNQLRELMDMYKEGLLSKQEFEAAKTKLLGL